MKILYTILFFPAILFSQGDVFEHILNGYDEVSFENYYWGDIDTIEELIYTEFNIPAYYEDEPYDSIQVNFQDNTKVLYYMGCLLYTSPSPRDATLSRMPSSA